MGGRLPGGRSVSTRACAWECPLFFMSYLDAVWIPLLRDRLFQLFKYGGIFQRGNILGYFFAPGERAQQAAHDFAGTGFRQIVAEANLIGPCDRPYFSRHPVAQSRRDTLGILALSA